MNKTPDEARKLATELKLGLADVAAPSGRDFVKDVDIALCPPFTALPIVAEVIRGSNIKLGAQNMHWEIQGAYTGEISGVFLKEIGCEYVIIGHSERRQYFFETDEIVNKKLKTALKLGLKPILCVGETLAEREQGKTFDVIKKQLAGAFQGIKAETEIVIAYEPVWAIGTGKTATPKQAAEVHKFIRDWLARQTQSEKENLRILYGGSVTPENIDELMAEPEINGVLVGGASLKSDSFIKIVLASQPLTSA